MKTLTPQQFSEARKIAAEMNLLKDKLGRITMFATMHALDEATRKIGYEMAERSPHWSAESRPEDGVSA